MQEFYPYHAKLIILEISTTPKNVSNKKVVDLDEIYILCHVPVSFEESRLLSQYTEQAMGSMTRV
jgi:hypothetical protein